MTTWSITFMKKYKFKKISNRDTGNDIQQLYEKYLTDNVQDFFQILQTQSTVTWRAKAVQARLDIWEYLTVTIERINSKCNRNQSKQADPVD